MGVGAVFVSTLALSKLPTPHSPPENQQEYLAATLQTIVSFVVLGSILIRTLIASSPLWRNTECRIRWSFNPILLFRQTHSFPDRLHVAHAYVAQHNLCHA